ncbi:F-box protein At3g07870-like [Syzygium oleosum]|uniref:F-box protein At3g07870-like n=1 Tax=Syzygium oleosum TaxID=219896 RepID=UPI0011D1F3B1|nr:F-box protein At3g07870-like [Syzygium oleosum]
MSSSSSASDEGPKLPHDVAVEVLKRLPVGSLLRCRCVCRPWRAAIDDPRFAALHLRHSALDASNRYLVSIDWRDPVHSLHSPFADPLQIEIPFVTPPPDSYRVVGSCNGLICITEISRNVCDQTTYLGNLFTRKHKAVRRSGREHQFICRDTAHVVLGFWFDAPSNDYLIVRIVYCMDNRSRSFGRAMSPVEIYSLGTDSWRSLECEVPAFCAYRPAVSVNGKLHWFAFDFDDLLGDVGFGSIVLFDVAGEVFDEMALPEEILHMDSVVSVVSVAVLNDLLAVFISRGGPLGHPDLHSNCSVWVMRDYGVPESWTKLYTFEASGLVYGFDGFTWNGELMVEIDSGERVSWNPITGQFTELPLWTTCDLVPVVESLVSL